MAEVKILINKLIKDEGIPIQVYQLDLNRYKIVVSENQKIENYILVGPSHLKLLQDCQFRVYCHQLLDVKMKDAAFNGAVSEFRFADGETVDLITLYIKITTGSIHETVAHSVDDVENFLNEVIEHQQQHGERDITDELQLGSSELPNVTFRPLISILNGEEICENIRFESFINRRVNNYVLFSPIIEDIEYDLSSLNLSTEGFNLASLRDSKVARAVVVSSGKFVFNAKGFTVNNNDNEFQAKQFLEFFENQTLFCDDDFEDLHEQFNLTLFKFLLIGNIFDFISFALLRPYFKGTAIYTGCFELEPILGFVARYRNFSMLDLEVLKKLNMSN